MIHISLQTVRKATKQELMDTLHLVKDLPTLHLTMGLPGIILIDMEVIEERQISGEIITNRRNILRLPRAGKEKKVNKLFIHCTLLYSILYTISSRPI